MKLLLFDLKMYILIETVLDIKSSKILFAKHYYFDFRKRT